jgi:hypothetical protein
MTIGFVKQAYLLKEITPARADPAHADNHFVCARAVNIQIVRTEQTPVI